MALEKEILGVLSEIRDYLKPKSVESRFIDNGDGTISDKKTGLMWAKAGSDKEMNFADAEKYCNEHNFGGHNDWRLPTIEESLTLVDYKKSKPAISDNFICKPDWYWTSTPCAGDSGYAWMVFFYGGRADWFNRSFNSYVRPVRQY